MAINGGTTESETVSEVADAHVYCFNWSYVNYFNEIQSYAGGVVTVRLLQSWIIAITETLGAFLLSELLSSYTNHVQI